MKNKIERIQLTSENIDLFLKEYWEREVPVILSGELVRVTKILSKEDIFSLFKKEESRQYGWYDSEIHNDLTPQLLTEIIKQPNISFRKKPLRIFMHPRGHESLAHYDGNSVHGFNYQYKGSKKWIIVSPHTPIRTIPFSYVVMKNDIDKIDSKYDHFDFTLNEGEMLFMPRYWQHQVTSLEDLNINLNWVMTPNFPSSSILGKRESEIVKLRILFPIINKFFFPDSIYEYGGVGKSLISQYSKDISFFKLLKRLVIELSSYLLVPFYFKVLTQKGKNFKNNNFNV